MKKETDQKFIDDIKTRLDIAQLGLKNNPHEAKEEAKNVISTLPIRLTNFFIKRNKHKGILYPYPTRIEKYSFYEHELVGEEIFGVKDGEGHKNFKPKTAGFYICEYLNALQIKYSVWCGTITILPE